MDLHFQQVPRRKAEFITPPNILKEKVGSGGLSEEILDLAQKLLEENTQDFVPLGSMYLDALMNGIDMAKGITPSEDPEAIIASMLYPAMQLKANGAMFHYQLITNIAEKLVQFLEVIPDPDIEAMEIILAFHTTMNAVLRGQIKGDGGDNGAKLLSALVNACQRYFDQS